jgi:hypothetical protein
MRRHQGQTSRVPARVGPTRTHTPRAGRDPLPAAQARGLTSSTLQMMVPSGMSPIGSTLPMCSVAFFPA